MYAELALAGALVACSTAPAARDLWAAAAFLYIVAPTLRAIERRERPLYALCARLVHVLATYTAILVPIDPRAVPPACVFAAILYVLPIIKLP